MRAHLLLLLTLTTGAWAQELKPESEQSTPPAEAPKQDTPTAPKLEPVATPVVEKPVEKPFVTSAFSYGARRAWFNGTRLLGAGLYYQGSYVHGLGGLVRADGVAPFQLNGVRIVERHGFISTLLMKAATGLLAVFGIMGSAMANSSIVHDGYFTDGGRTFVVEHTYVVTTADQRAQFASDAASLTQMVDDVGPGQVASTDDFGAGLWADFTVYDPRLAVLNRAAAGGTGYELSFGGDFKLGELFSLPVVLDVGLAMASIRAPRVDGSIDHKTYLYDCFGVVGRLHVPLSRFVTFSAEWTLNFWALNYLIAPEDLAKNGTVVSMPLKANLELHATDRFFARGSVILGGLGFNDGKLGFGVDVGVRL